MDFTKKDWKTYITSHKVTPVDLLKSYENLVRFLLGEKKIQGYVMSDLNAMMDHVKLLDAIDKKVNGESVLKTQTQWYRTGGRSQRQQQDKVSPDMSYYGFHPVIDSFMGGVLVHDNVDKKEKSDLLQQILFHAPNQQSRRSKLQEFVRNRYPDAQQQQKRKNVVNFLLRDAGFHLMKNETQSSLKQKIKSYLQYRKAIDPTIKADIALTQDELGHLYNILTNGSATIERKVDLLRKALDQYIKEQQNQVSPAVLGVKQQPKVQPLQQQEKHVQQQGKQVQPKVAQVQPKVPQVQPKVQPLQQQEKQVQQLQQQGKQVQPLGIQQQGKQVQPQGKQVQPQGKQVQPQVQPKVQPKPQPLGIQQQEKQVQQLQQQGKQVQPLGIQQQGKQVQQKVQQQGKQVQQKVQPQPAKRNMLATQKRSLQSTYLDVLQVINNISFTQKEKQDYKQALNQILTDPDDQRRITNLREYIQKLVPSSVLNHQLNKKIAEYLDADYTLRNIQLTDQQKTATKQVITKSLPQIARIAKLPQKLLKNVHSSHALVNRIKQVEVFS